MATPIFEVRQVTALNEKEQTKAALAIAFDNEIFTSVVTNRDDKFVGDFWYSTLIAGLLGGEVYVAEDTDTKCIVGAAVWFPPNHEMYDTEEQQNEALSILMRRFSEELRTWWMQGLLPKYDEFTNSVLGKGTKLKAWHLQTIGVHPKYQRKGIATAFVDRIKKKAKADGSALCLESGEHNVVVYEHLGFKDKGKLLIKGIPGAGEFVMVAMMQETVDAVKT